MSSPRHHNGRKRKLNSSRSCSLQPSELESSCSGICCSLNERRYDLRKYAVPSTLECVHEADNSNNKPLENQEKNKENNNENMEPSSPSGSGSIEVPPSPDFVALVKQVEDDEEYARMLQNKLNESDDPVMRVRQFEEDEQLAWSLQNSSDPARRSIQIEADEAYARVLLGPEEVVQITVSSRTEHQNNDDEDVENLSSSLFVSDDESSDRHSTGSDVTENSNEEDSDEEDVEDEEFFSSEDADEIGSLGSAEINRLPSKIFQRPTEQWPNYVIECHVCMNDFEDGDCIRVLPCFHEFHAICIDPWLSRNNTCPVCRVCVKVD